MPVRPFLRPYLPAAAVAAALLGLSALDRPQAGQDADPAAVPAGAEKKDEPKTYRLPAGYGAVGLSREQKRAAYAVMAKYDGRVAELERQIAQIEAAQDAEIAAVLTPGQRRFLDEWRAGRAAEKAAEKEGGAAEDKNGGDAGE